MKQELTIEMQKYRVLSGSALKVIAVVTMLIDHIASVFLRNSTIVLLTVLGHKLTLYTLMRAIGRIAFPIYAFLIVEGYLHTSDRVKYGASLAFFALLSEIPWDLEHTGRAFVISSQNVFFTLFIGYLGICMFERYRKKPLYQAAWLLGLLGISVLLRADYRTSGYCFILFMYFLREHEFMRAVIGCGFLSSTWIAGLAFIPITMYNGERGFIRGKVLKYAFYLIYPVHIFILYLLKKALIGY